MVAVRGSNIVYVHSTDVGTISLPAGSTTNDFCVLFAAHSQPVVNVPPLGFDQIDDSSAYGAAFKCNLTAEQISIGSVEVGFEGGGSGIIGIVVFVGQLAGIRTLISLGGATHALTETLTTDATPVAGDYALYFGEGGFVTGSSSPTVTSSAGASLQTSFNLSASGSIYGASLGASGATSSTFTFSAAPLGDYEVIVVVAPTPKAGLQLRAPLIAVESVPEGAVTVAVRASLIIVEPLTEQFRTLRMPLLCIESLHPVPPEGTVSTQLFPGSLGSSVSLPGLAFSFHKKPSFATQSSQSASGFSSRNPMRQYPIWLFESTFEFLRADVTQEYQAMLGFYLQRLGAFDTFLFKDADDYIVTGGTLGTADGVTTQFAFKRTLGGFAEKVGQVDNGLTINVYDNGVLKTAGVHYNVVMPNLVVFVTAPTAGHVITADFQFFFNCKFSEDLADFSKFAAAFWELQSLPFESVPQ